MTMKERIAEIIDPDAFKALSEHGDGLGAWWITRKRRALEKAEDVLKAMQEPTEPMIIAMQGWREFDPLDEYIGPNTTEHAQYGAYRAMITAALEDK